MRLIAVLLALLVLSGCNTQPEQPSHPQGLYRGDDGAIHYLGKAVNCPLDRTHALYLYWRTGIKWMPEGCWVD